MKPYSPRLILGTGLVVLAVGLAPAFAQDGPKGGGGAGGGGSAGGGGNGGGGGVVGVSGGGNSAGAPSGGGGGSSFGGGGSMSGGGGGGGFSSDWPTLRGGNRSGGNRNGNGERAVPAPAYARSVPPGSAVPGSRPRGDRPALGFAVERTTPIDRGNRGGGFDTRRYDPYSFGAGFYYSPFRNCTYYSLFDNCYPYGNYDPFYAGFGYYGLNSMYYDPYWFYGSQGAAPPTVVNPASGLGALRLKIKPNKGQVFVDNVYVGTVDEFDGMTQRLKLEQGRHRVEVRLAGYEPLVFEVMIRRGDTTIFEGTLRPRQ
jgi:PEGA domain-containing protein